MPDSVARSERSEESHPADWMKIPREAKELMKPNDLPRSLKLDRNRHAAPQVFERLRDLILALEMTPGTVLSRVELAERFIGTPYLWGGRTRLGIDCSGLVQVTLEAAGVAAPRDTDMQQAELGAEVAIADVLDGMQRGDLIYWKGHVGIMADSITLVHANAHHMQVVAETLPEAIERIAKLGAEIAAVKRLPGLSG